jgi:hypothetical protein
MNRKQLIQSLLEFDSNLNDLQKSLSQLEWDTDERITCLPSHIIHVLKRFMDFQCTAEDVETWANLVEARDDVELSGQLREVMFELANPKITQGLSIERASALIANLGNTGKIPGPTNNLDDNSNEPS